ncbi:glycosyltransferase family 4 protein [Streptosporangium sp. NBC_01755]|uniref:glycosyltransferase family 4 protein n=1 Tax=unclassified Streptosporangium TaxID=2632669 RepID=UPI002DD7BB84|nr:MULTISPECIES: glycosyltransferase family 4 protein [unclassified Streptosporangium]WSA24050.1 glycosyltransferase family 4 protein [Streptosporangium sp. NBC_01810]WSC97878.1 glycosyltransferase family 4 protein [Streptosporangium sp. NBC_01755]
MADTVAFSGGDVNAGSRLFDPSWPNLSVEVIETPEASLRGVRVAVLNFREPQQSAAGGAEEYAWQVSRHLIAQGASVHFVTGREPGQAGAERRNGVELRRMGNRYLVYLLVPLWLLLHRRRFDVVIDSMNGIPFFSPLVVRRRTTVLCLVHHVHDRQFHAFLPSWLARIGCFIEGPVARLLYRRRTTITVSESSRTDLRTRLRWLAPIQVVPNGSSVARSAARHTLPGDPALVYLGRLVGHKRVDRVVGLAAELAESRPDLRVHVVGRGPETDALLATAAELGVADRVHLHGFLSESGKNAVLGSALLNVTASEFEGWGLTVIEAAAFGVPTVAYDVAGLRDSIKDGVTGWLVRDGETLADAVDRAIEELADPVRRTAIQQACRTWAGEFTWGRTGATMTRLIATELPAAVRRQQPVSAVSSPVRTSDLHLAMGETDPI